MASPAVYVELPSASLFRFPPNSIPPFSPPPPAGSTSFAPPINIPDHIYVAALDARVPLTIAAVYAVTAKALNVYNRSTGRRPWAISKTRAFFVFVVLHNIFLAVYSAWTFHAMWNILRRSFVSPFASTVDSSTGSISNGGWAGTVDGYCRLNGAPGLGNGLFFNEAAGKWQTSSSIGDSFAALDRSQPGRMWNEGLSFYGWIFYLSKFYEVLDTFIILAKGKFSSTLQTYHHAGAMMCMWAGMRYMSAPIWVFAFVNSGIHALMYTYYTITAFSIRVPTSVKRALTTLQITQFLVGASYTMMHSFISYGVPVVLKSESQIASGSDEMFQSIDTMNSSMADAANSVRYGFKTVPCIRSTGETFAIWLNVLYLAPLTYLFGKFFVTSYLRRSNAENARAARLGKKEGQATSSSVHNANATIATTIATTASAAEALMRRRLSNVSNLAEKAGWDAARGLEKEVYGESGEAIEEDEDEVSPRPDLLQVKSRSRRAN